TNVLGEWQGNFRVGPLDLVLLRYAAEAVRGVGPTAATPMGGIGEAPSLCKAYTRGDALNKGGLLTAISPPQRTGQRRQQLRIGRMLNKATPILEPLYDQVVEEIETATGAPVTILGYGPQAQNKPQ